MHKRHLLTLLVVLSVLLLPMLVLPAHADRDKDRGGVERFATLPSKSPGHPEGIAADDRGNIYASSFDFGFTTQAIYIFRPDGKLRDTITLPTGVLPLGLIFDRLGNLYVADFGGGNVLKYSPPFNSSSAPTATFHVCGGSGAGCGLNAMDFDHSGNLYVSDSFGGKIFKITLPGGSSAEFFSDELLKPGSHGFPPFGANGLAFDAHGTALFIANTADDRILKLDLLSGKLTTFAESINGADGILFVGDLLWVCANQADELVALNAKGRIVKRRGSFEGIGKDGAVKGLLFPASLVFSGGSLFVTNLALALTDAKGDEPEEDVTTFTLSKISLHDDD